MARAFWVAMFLSLAALSAGTLRIYEPGLLISRWSQWVAIAMIGCRLFWFRKEE